MKKSARDKRFQVLEQGMLFHKTDGLPEIPDKFLSDADESDLEEDEEEQSLEEKKMVKITRTQIRRILREAMELDRSSMLPKNHVDGQPWGGTLEDLAKVQGRTWGHGDVVDSKGWSSDVKRAGRFTTGKEKSIFESRIVVKESAMKERYGEIEHLVLATVEEDPGIPGRELASTVATQHSRIYDTTQPVGEEEVFSVLDVLIDEMDIFFDEEGDGFYISGSEGAADVIVQRQREEDRFEDMGVRARQSLKGR